MSYRTGAERFYDLFGEKNDVEFYVSQALRLGGKALELGVGTARLAIHLARAGVETWGIDNSTHMLKAAERNRQKEEPRTRSLLHLEEADAVDFRLPHRFSLVYFPSGSFDHILDPADQRRALRCIKRHLTEGGVYVFDLYLASRDDPERGWFVQRKPTVEDTVVVRSGYSVTDWDRRVMTLDMWYEVVRDGRVEERYHEGSMVYLHDAAEVQSMLREEGFKVTAMYGSHAGSPFGEGDRQVIYVAQPRGKGTVN